MNEREFTLEEVASMVSGVLLVEKGLALVDIACFMLEREVDPEEIPYVAGEIRRRILQQHPSLQAIGEIGEMDSLEEVAECVRRLKEAYGETFVLKAREREEKLLFKKLLDCTRNALFKKDRMERAK